MFCIRKKGYTYALLEKGKAGYMLYGVCALNIAFDEAYVLEAAGRKEMNANYLEFSTQLLHLSPSPTAKEHGVERRKNWSRKEHSLDPSLLIDFI